MKLEIQLDGNAEIALEQLADHFDADPEEIAAGWIRQRAGEEFGRLVASENTAAVEEPER